MKQRYIGIDLGTTNSTISVASLTPNGSIVPKTLDVKQVDETGMNFSYKSILPSIIYIDDHEELYVGEFARKMLGVYPQNVIRKSKRYIGEDNTWSINNSKYRAEQAGSFILKALKQQAEEYYNGEEITGAVITIPANFNLVQENATRKAAELAGFDKEKIFTIAEPTAALLDFINEQRQLAPESRSIDLSNGVKQLLVFDLGGGTCDVSILRVEEKANGHLDIKEMTTSQYTELGGVDFDEMIAQNLMVKLMKEKGLTQRDLQTKFDKGTLISLYENLVDFAEKAKHYFSTKIGISLRNKETKYIGNSHEYDNVSYRQMLIGLPPELTSTLTMTKKEYDGIIKPLLYHGNKRKNIEDPLISALKNSSGGEVRKEEIDAIFLVGGMTHYPTIQERVYEIFDGRLKPVTSVNPMNSVSRGASVYHYYLEDMSITKAGKQTEETTRKATAVEEKTVTVRPRITQNIFVQVVGGHALPLIEAGTEAPFSKNVEKELMVTGSHGTDKVHAMKLDLFTAETPTSIFKQKLKSAVMHFKKPVPVNSLVQMRVEFTNDRQVTVKAWLKDDETQMFDVKIGEHEFSNEEINRNDKLIEGINKLRSDAV